LLYPTNGAHIIHSDEEVCIMRRITRWTSALCLASGLMALAGPAAAAADMADGSNGQDNGSYGYLRTVESAATLIQAGSKDRTPADVNQPLMVGDRIQVPEGSKVELILPDHNLVRLDGGSDLVLEHLAGSPDGNDRATVLRLLEGNAQLVVTEDSLGDELPRVDTANATVYPQDFGTYRIAADKGGWSEVTVRYGKAQVVTDQGSEDLGAGEQAVVEAEIDVHEATGMDGLERWAMRLDQESEQQAGADGLNDVNEDLRYSAAPLNRYGGWVTVSNQRYWRPRVADDWRPYTDGRWVYTPSGMTWVSSEPWGWVPYHYGSWDYVPGYGWLWQPGYVYSPAWVYWYWGPSYTGWCPMGYYTRYYASAGFGGFHAGVYGWAGGDWGAFSRWTFVSSSYWRGYHDGYRNGFRDGRGHWDVRRYAVPIQELQRGGRHLERGLITTDTHGLRPDTWADPVRATEVLRNNMGRRPGRDRGELPDVSAFVARKPQLPPNVAERVKAGPDDINRFVGTPLRPNTLGRGERAGRGGRDGSGMGGVRVTPVPQNKPGVDRSGRPGRPGTDAGGVTGNPGGNTGRNGRRPVPQTPPQTPGVEGGRPGRNGGPRVTPINPPTAEQPAPDNRPRSGRPAPGDQGGAPRPDHGNPGTVDRGDRGNRGGRPGGPQVTPVEPSNPDRNPRSGRPAPGDQGGSPRPDRGGREVAPKVTPVTPPPATDRNPRSGRPAPGDQGGSPRPDHGNQGNQGNVDRGNRGGQTDRGNQGSQDHGNQGNRGGQTDRGNQGSQDHGNQGNRGGQTDRGNQGSQDRGNRERESPPPKRDRDDDKKPPSMAPSSMTYIRPERPTVYGERTGQVDRSGSSRPAYTPQPPPVYRPAAPQPTYRQAAPQPTYRPAERVAPQQPRWQPAPVAPPVQQRPAAQSSGSGSNNKPAERRSEPAKHDRRGDGR
jgi:hypothetical protein